MIEKAQSTIPFEKNQVHAKEEEHANKKKPILKHKTKRNKRLQKQKQNKIIPFYKI